MKKANRLIVLCLVLLALLLASACGSSRQGEQASQEEKNQASEEKPKTSIGGISTGEHRMIATVNGEDIYEDVFMEWYLQTMTLGLGLDMSTDQNEQVASFLESYKYSYLVGYAEQTALLQEAGKNNIAAGEQEVENYRETLMTTYAGSEEAFQPIQAMWGFTDASLRNYLKQQITLQLLYEEKTKDITEPDQTPEAYYNENPTEFHIDETRTVRHILVEGLEEATEIIASLNEGADFAAFVAEKSLDEGSAENGGVIGPFDSYGAMAGGGNLVEPFTTASYALENVGDITQTPVESEYGFHIIILDEITPAYSQSFDEVKDDLTYQLLADAKEKRFDEYYQSVIEAASITYAEYATQGSSGSSGGSTQ